MIELKQHHSELDTRIRRIDAAHGDTSQLLAQLQAFVANAEALIEGRYQKLAGGAGVFIQPWPSYSGEEIVKRELENRRPFLKKEVGTIGHRDTVIWLGLIELTQSFPNDIIFFVTDDNGFKEDGKLHPDLHADLAGAGVDADHIRLYSQVHPVLEYLSAVELVDKDGDDEEDEKTEDGGIGDEEDEGTDSKLSDVPDLATWRAAITQALWEYNDALKDLTWTRTPSHDGDYYYPEWEIGLPNALEDTELTAIDGPFEVSIQPVHAW